MMLRLHRFEFALVRETRYVTTATDDHAQIMASLRASDLRAACAALKRNQQGGKAPIVALPMARAGACRSGEQT